MSIFYDVGNFIYSLGSCGSRLFYECGNYICWNQRPGMKPDRNKLLLWLQKEIVQCEESMKKVDDHKLFVETNGKKLFGIPAFIVLIIQLAPSIIFWVLSLSIISSDKKRRDIFSRGESQLLCISDSSSNDDDGDDNNSFFNDDYNKHNSNCFYNTTLMSEQNNQTGQECNFDEIQSYANSWKISTIFIKLIMAISIISFIAVFFKLFGSILYYDTSYHRHWSDAQIAIYIVSNGFPVQIIAEDFYSKKKESLSILECYAIQAICDGAKENKSSVKKEESSSLASCCTNILIALMITLESGVPGTLASLYMNYFLLYFISVCNTGFFLYASFLVFPCPFKAQPFLPGCPLVLSDFAGSTVHQARSELEVDSSTYASLVLAFLMICLEARSTDVKVRYFMVLKASVYEIVSKVAFPIPTSPPQKIEVSSTCHPHVLTYIKDKNWYCDGKNFDGGCKNFAEGTLLDNTVLRYGCKECNFDLCEYCVLAYFKESDSSVTEVSKNEATTSALHHRV